MIAQRLDRLVDTVDAFQRRHAVLALPVGVLKKFSEDRAGYLAALVSYYTIFSVFPLLLVAVTVLGFVLEGRPGLQQDLVDSALSQVPVIGPQLEGEAGSLGGSAPALAVGIVGSLWAGLGAAQALQTAMDEIWDVPMRDRHNFLMRRLRAATLVGVLAVGAVATFVVSNAATRIGGITWFSRASILVGNLALNVGLFWVVFQALGKLTVRWRDLLPGAVAAGVAWTGLHVAGSYYYDRVVAGATDTYGTFAVVIGLLSWFYLLTNVVILAAEVNPVVSRHMWPRSLSGRNLTAADRAAHRKQVLEVLRVDADDIGLVFEDHTTHAGGGVESGPRSPIPGSEHGAAEDGHHAGA